jgi:hypothetical protein
VEAELAALLVSVKSNSRRKMGLQQSLNNELFIEQIPYIQLDATLKDRASYISFVLIIIWNWRHRNAYDIDWQHSCYKRWTCLLNYITVDIYCVPLFVGWSKYCTEGLNSRYEVAAGIFLYRNGIFTIGKLTPSIYPHKFVLKRPSWSIYLGIVQSVKQI